MKRSASALWQGDLKDGRGQLTSDSGVLYATPYSFHTRFEDQKGTNPEELIAAAHAGCFSMALSGELQKMKLTADFIQTKAQVNLDKTDEGWSVTAVHLNVSARVPNAQQEDFMQAAQAAKAGCPISRLLKSINITMDARLDKAENSLRPEMTF